jgi:hypothetical protein
MSERMNWRPTRKPIRVGRPARVKLHGKKREHGQNSCDFGMESRSTVRQRYKMAVCCVQSWRASCNCRDVAAAVNVLHATNRGANAGDDFASNTSPVGKRVPSIPGRIEGSRPHLPQPRTLRARRYRTFSHGWAFRPNWRSATRAEGLATGWRRRGLTAPDYGSISTPGFMIPRGSRVFFVAFSAAANRSGRCRSYQGRCSRPTA